MPNDRPLSSLRERVIEFLQEEASVKCEVRELNGPRRYWCLTHTEYGTYGGCVGERARTMVAELEANPDAF